MDVKPKTKLLTKVLIIGTVIAVLSYLFHPQAGQFSIVWNGQPIAEPLARFAAVPVFLAIMAFTGLLTAVLFLGAGALIFLVLLSAAFLICAVIAPYFAPMLVIIFLVIALTAVDHK